MSMTKLACLAIAALTSGCIIVDDDDDHPPPVDQPADAYYTTIDAGFTLSTNLGEGVGVFVEYDVGGLWSVWTSCDTAITDYTCSYEINVSARSPVFDAGTVDAELDDDLQYYGDSGLSFFAYTDYDKDGFEFTTDSPGALVEMEVILDGYIEPQDFRWYGNGQVHNGAPYSPVVFQPDQP